MWWPFSLRVKLVGSSLQQRFTRKVLAQGEKADNSKHSGEQNCIIMKRRLWGGENRFEADFQTFREMGALRPDHLSYILIV